MRQAGSRGVAGLADGDDVRPALGWLLAGFVVNLLHGSFSDAHEGRRRARSLAETLSIGFRPS